MAKQAETFVAYVRGGEDIGPAPSVNSAVHRADAACKAGRSVMIRGEYTSDGSYWPNHRGRVVAQCDRKKWLVETFPSLSGAKRKRRKAKTSCPVNMGTKKAPKAFRAVRR